MNEAPNVISTKDLLYIEDMMNWNYIFIKNLDLICELTHFDPYCEVFIQDKSGDCEPFTLKDLAWNGTSDDNDKIKDSKEWTTADSTKYLKLTNRYTKAASRITSDLSDNTDALLNAYSF